MAEPRLTDRETVRPDPSAVTRLATAYWASMVLFTANRLGVFTFLGESEKTAEEVAQHCDSDARATAMLLNAAVAHGLLLKKNGLYSNSPVAAGFLVRGQPGFLGDALKYSEDLYPLWGELAGAVSDGRPPARPEMILGEDPQKTRNFVLGMHNRALGVARSLATSLDLSGRRRLLDVGGGPGTYSILLVQQTPGLRSTVLDLPPVVAIARELIAEAGCADRVDTVGGDFSETEFERDNDVVLMSGILHRERPASCRRLLAKAFEALEPGGQIVVSDVFFDSDSKDSPTFATLFALTMFLTSEHGAAHSIDEMSAWMAEAGFIDPDVRPLPPPMPHSMILGTKPL